MDIVYMLRYYDIQRIFDVTTSYRDFVNDTVNAIELCRVQTLVLDFLNIGSLAMSSGVFLKVALRYQDLIDSYGKIFEYWSNGESLELGIALGKIITLLFDYSI
jgi:hypothetical protein